MKANPFNVRQFSIKIAETWFAIEKWTCETEALDLISNRWRAKNHKLITNWCNLSITRFRLANKSSSLQFLVTLYTLLPMKHQQQLAVDSNNKRKQKWKKLNESICLLSTWSEIEKAENDEANKRNEITEQQLRHDMT